MSFRCPSEIRVNGRYVSLVGTIVAVTRTVNPKAARQGFLRTESPMTLSGHNRGENSRGRFTLA